MIHLLHLALQKLSRCVHDQPAATDFDGADLTLVYEFLNHGPAQSGGNTEVANVHSHHKGGSFNVAETGTSRYVLTQPLPERLERLSKSFLVFQDEIYNNYLVALSRRVLRCFLTSRNLEVALSNCQLLSGIPYFCSHSARTISRALFLHGPWGRGIS
jgi:hypothetical protein